MAWDEPSNWEQSNFNYNSDSSGASPDSEVTWFIQTPTGESLSPIKVRPGLALINLKDEIRKQLGVDVEPCFQRLFCDEKELLPKLCIGNYGVIADRSEFSFPNDSIIKLVLDSRFSWSHAIRQHEPKVLETQIPLENYDFTVIFQSKADNFKWLKDFEENVQVPKLANFQNLWDKHLQGGFRFWSYKIYPQRVMVLELRKEFSEIAQKRNPETMMCQLNAVRYNVEGTNRGYSGGDYRSWQRYTAKEPFECDVHFDRYNELHIRTKGKFQPLTWYALVLLHNTVGHTHPILEDYIIPFKTQQCFSGALKIKLFLNEWDMVSCFNFAL
jgi:hypothetical protein